VFANPSAGNKLQAANDAKWHYSVPQEFQIVLSTLAEDAQCVRFVLLMWHKLLFWEDQVYAYEEVGQEHGGQRQKQDLEERIEKKYEAVLELLAMGIERLKGE
jgi:hypothetical protein